MGASQSVRATAFQRPMGKPAEPQFTDDELDNHISISNKMVERLVEDAALVSGVVPTTPPPAPRTDYRDKIFIEKLKCLDESHSEKTGITIEDLRAVAARIDMRTSNMVSTEPICAECKQMVIDCYTSAKSSADIAKCWETVDEFTTCVQRAAVARLRARTAREARERARRTRHVAHAREHALRDLASN